MVLSIMMKVLSERGAFMKKNTRKSFFLQLFILMTFFLLSINGIAAEDVIQVPEETELTSPFSEERSEELPLLYSPEEENQTSTEQAAEEEMLLFDDMIEDDLRLPDEVDEEIIFFDDLTDEEQAQIEEEEIEESILSEDLSLEELALSDEVEEVIMMDEPAAADPGSGTCGDGLTWTLSDDGELNISGTGAMTDWSGDSSVPWYNDRNKIKKVNISGATSIGKYAFYGCSALTSVSIPATITNIGYMAFYQCTSLGSIYIPSSVTSIGTFAFTECTALTEITVHSSNSKYSSLDGVLLNKTNTQIICCPAGRTGNYTVPASVTTIGADAFYKSALTGITLQEGLTNIGNEAFIYCTSLTSLTIPRSVTNIGYRAFAYISSLSSVTFLGSVPTFGKVSSSYDVFLNVTATAYYPVGDESWTEDVRIGYGGTLTWVEGTYGKCGDALYLTLEGSTLTISGTGDMWDFYDSSNVPWHSYVSSIKTVVIENGVTSIGRSAFQACTSLTNITIPDSVTGIGRSAFQACTSLTNITIPDSVTSIGSWAFGGCTNLTNVTIPDSVTSIGNGAFYNCTSLTNIMIPDSVTSIAVWAFQDCTSLTNITIPDSVTSIGKGAFDGCTSLTNVTIPDGVKSIGEDAFWKCTSLTNITIPDGVTSIGNHAFYLCTKLTTITFAGSPPTFGSDVFHDVTATVTYLPVESFGWTSNVMQNYGGTLTWVCDNKCGDDVTWYLSADGVLTISGTGDMWDFSIDDPGYYSFRKSIVSAVIENGVTSIGDCAFYNCTSLTNVATQDSVTSIRDGAFWDCTSLSTIIFAGSAPAFGTKVFHNVTTTAYYPAGDPTWTEDVMQDYDGTITWVSDLSACVIGSISEKTYTGKEIKPVPTVTVGSITLVKDTDYTVSYKNNTNVGTATVTITGTGKYVGTATKTFTISPVKVDIPTGKNLTYTGKEQTGVASGADYTISANTGTNAGSYTAMAVLKDKNNYTWSDGTITDKKISWTIAPAENTLESLPIVEKIILDQKSENDVAGSTYSLLQAKGKPKSQTAIKLTWKTVNGATKYIIYGNKCGRKNKYKKIGETSGKSFTQKKLKKGTYYKYLIVAVQGDKVLSVSKTIHVATKGGKVGNNTKVTIQKGKKKTKKISLEVKKTAKIKTSLAPGKLKVGIHRKTKFESDNPAVATVTAKGKIKAVAKGTCYIYAYAQNGVFAKIKVTVK